MIPRRLIRVWLGPKPISDRYEGWWEEYRQAYPGWDLVTVGNEHVDRLLTPELRDAYEAQDRWAGRADILRLLALERAGGVYVDCDTLPVAPINHLLLDERPFASFEKPKGKRLMNCVMGSPAGHPAIRAVLDAHAAEPGTPDSPVRNLWILTETWAHRTDVRKLPAGLFNPVQSYSDRKRLFDSRRFPAETLIAHALHNRWGHV